MSPTSPEVAGRESSPRVAATLSGVRSCTKREANRAIPKARSPVTTNAEPHVATARTYPVSTGTVRPPKLLPIIAKPMARPFDFGNHSPTSLPAGSMFIPENMKNWRKLRA